MTLREWHSLRRHAKQFHRDAEPEILAPPEAFSDRASDDVIRSRYLVTRDPTLVGPKSQTVLSRITSSCAGWPRPPSTEEFYAAIHATDPDERQQAVIWMWMTEATNDQIVLAWAEGVYTIRDLVRAIHRTSRCYPELNIELNRLASR